MEKEIHKKNLFCVTFVTLQPYLAMHRHVNDLNQ